MSRFLFGPVSRAAPPAPHRDAGRPLPDSGFVSFGVVEGTRADIVLPTGCGWDAVVERLGETPRAVLAWPGYAEVPDWAWAAPVPVVALAIDWTLLWHAHRHALLLSDAVLTDAAGVAAFKAAGIGNPSPACLYGLGPDWYVEEPPSGDGKDIDVLFAGSVNPAAQGDRLPWLARVARLSERHRVVVATGVFGAEYRNLLRRAKVVVNRSARGEANQRAFEAVAAGAVLVNEADNRELSSFLTPGKEWLPYSTNDLEAVVGGVLADDARRRAVVARAGSRVSGFAFERLLTDALDRLDWDDLNRRAAERAANPRELSTAGRVWAWASASDRAPLPAGDPHARGLASADPADSEASFRNASSDNRVSRLALAEVLSRRERPAEAVAELRALLAAQEPLSPAECDTVPFPGGFDRLRVAWEAAAARRPGDASGEGDAKVRLLRGRARELLAALAGELDDYRAAADEWPDNPTLHAALGCALARAGRIADALDPLRRSVAADPFDAAAARALYQALLDAGDLPAAAALAADRRRLHAAAPTLLPAEPYFAPPPADGVVRVSSEQFHARFGRPDTSEALTGFTNRTDTDIVLSLAVHLDARRVLEVGTADGRMTANLTRFTHADAVVHSVGLTARQAAASNPDQAYEVPPDGRFGEHADRFGLARKARFVTADSRAVDFDSFAPLDLAFVDGGHDLDTATSDSLGAYRALRPGGILAWHDWDSPVPWVEVKKAVLALRFAEPVTHVAGTGVAFLVKGEGVGGTAGPDTATVSVRWAGEFEPVHSLAAVNRAVCVELLARGQRVGVVPLAPGVPPSATVALSPELAAAPLPRPDAHVRHAWPPDFTPPPDDAPFVLIQPWEYGRLPRAWVAPILANVDEVWAYTHAVARCYVASGVPADRVRVVPLGVDADRFRPGLDRLPLRTRKAVRLLFVGGTIPRKGFDALLAAYRRAFSASDGVCLVVRAFGGSSVYRGQGDPDWRAKWAADPDAPAVEVIEGELSEADMPRLYAACDALVHPYRGEGFALPVLEAMACGLPVAVTAGGATDDFVPPAAGWKIPAAVRYFAEEKVDRWPTAGRPWWLEPDPDALVAVLKTVVADAKGRTERGAAARRAALAMPWSRTAAEIEARVRELRTRTPARFRTAGRPTPAPVRLPASPRRGTDNPVSLTMIVRNEAHNLPDCLGPLRGLVGEMVVVDTGSTDDTRRVAASLGATVSEFPWVDDFAAARNAALERATRPWAFWMDADDRLDAENAVKLAALFASLREGDPAAYVVQCVCVPDAPGGTATVVDHVRLFPRLPGVKWRFRVHEQILPALRAAKVDVRWSDVAVRHVGYVDPALRARKLARDTRLLELELAEHPDDPFALFNLGAVRHETGEWAAAVPLLERSLALSHPRDSIVRKTHALLVQCRTRMGDPAGAELSCAAGRRHYPDDAELLFLAAGLARDRDDPTAAERLYRQLLAGTDAPHFGSVDSALRGPKARHNLGLLLAGQGRTAEAFDQWRLGLAADPAFVPSWLAMAEWSARTSDRAGEAVALRRVVELRPELEDVKRRLGEIGG